MLVYVHVCTENCIFVCLFAYVKILLLSKCHQIILMIYLPKIWTWQGIKLPIFLYIHEWNTEEIEKMQISCAQIKRWHYFDRSVPHLYQYLVEFDLNAGNMAYRNILCRYQILDIAFGIGTESVFGYVLIYHCAISNRRENQFAYFCFNTFWKKCFDHNCILFILKKTCFFLF